MRLANLQPGTLFRLQPSGDVYRKQTLVHDQFGKVVARNLTEQRTVTIDAYANAIQLQAWEAVDIYATQ